MTVQIIPCKPGTISAEDKVTLRDNGVIVIECESPETLRMISAEQVVTGTRMLYAAMKGLQRSDNAKQDFAHEIYKQVCESWEKRGE